MGKKVILVFISTELFHMNREPSTIKPGDLIRLKRIKSPFPVLDGELAVPCCPESAIPGSNPHLRFSTPGEGKGKRR